MRNAFILFIFLFEMLLLLSCSEGGTGTTEKNTLPSSGSGAPENVSKSGHVKISVSLKKTIDSLLQEGYVVLHPDTFESVPEKEYFSLLDPISTFSSQEWIYLSQGNVVRARMKKNAEIVLEEYMFTSADDLTTILSAMTKKLDNPGQERYLKRPFTYWPYDLAICHIFTANEQDRKELERINNLWIGIQTPPEP